MNKLTNIQPYEVSLVAKGANKKRFNIFKSADMDEPQNINEPTNIDEPTNTDEPQNVDSTIIDVKKATNKINKENQGGKAMANVDLKLFKGFSEDEIKDLPENILTKLETVFKTNESIVEKSAQLENQLKEKEEKEKMQGFITKAETEFDKLPIKPEELASILKSISEKDAENYSKLENFLKGANTMLKENYLFKEIGSNASDKGGSGSAWARAEAMAKTIVQKDSEMSIEKAISRVFDEHQELYKEYLEGK